MLLKLLGTTSWIDVTKLSWTKSIVKSRQITSGTFREWNHLKLILMNFISYLYAITHKIINCNSLLIQIMAGLQTLHWLLLFCTQTSGAALIDAYAFLSRQNCMTFSADGNKIKIHCWIIWYRNTTLFGKMYQWNSEVYNAAYLIY